MVFMKAIDMVEKKPLELSDALDMAIGGILERIAELEQRVRNLELGIKGGKANE